MKWAMALAFAAAAYGQQIDLSALDNLAKRAKSDVNVSLDESKLGLASAFLSGDDPNQAAAKNLVSGLKGINVRVFEFENASSFTVSDMEGIRSQLRAPGWSKMVEARDGDELAEVYVFSKGKDFGGLTVIAAEKRELVVVNIVGPVDLKALGSLGGKFGIPKDIMNGMMPGMAAPQPQPKPAPSKPAKPAPRKPAPEDD